MNRRRVLLGLILAGYLVITLAYGALNPLFEAPDEHWHFFTAAHIADTGRLPRVTDPPDEWLGQEAAQPPLYYLLGGLLIVPFDTGGARDAVRLNPFAWIGDASALTNINRMIHTPAEARPWADWATAAHLLRVFSTLLGLGTLLCIYGSGRRLWPESTTRPLMATALVAFLPQFNFLHASITNDALVIFLCSLALYQLIDLTGGRAQPVGPSGTSSRPPVRSSSFRLVLLGLTIGLAALSKNAGALLLLYSLGFLGVVALRDGQLRRYWRTALLVAGPALLVAGWLWLRNWQLYGDWTATAPFIAIAGGDRGYTLGQVLGESKGLLLSLVAVFGWFNLRPPEWVYWLWAAIAGLAAVGALACIARRNTRYEIRDTSEEDGSKLDTAHPPLSTAHPPLITGHWPLITDHWPLTTALLLALWPLLVYAGLAAFMLRTEAAQGRLLLPAVLPLALGVAWGLSGWGRCAPGALGKFNRRLAPLVALAALATTLYCLLFVIRPAYQRPPAIAVIPPTARLVLPELIERGRGVSLLAAEVETEQAAPGDVVRLTLYWTAATPPAASPEFVLELFGRDMQRIANLHSYHGRGLYPADLWEPGAIIADRFAVRIAPDAEAPVLGRVFVRINDGAPGIEVATVKIVPREPLPAPDGWAAELGDRIALVGAAIRPEQALPGQTIEVLVRWYVPVGVPDRDYTALIHLGQPDAEPLATGDSPPLGGAYPTSAWGNGETIDDVYFLTLPTDLLPGRYPVWIGLYDPATGERLPVKVEGELQPNGVYLAGWVEVGE
ncbi:MAG TPA: phospholipid carrier-dependent glycosyltransferase [Promineifilum sp.]|nr:phospholipid carrier-dependent glycosyltransferase [Promineifilum sp.]HRQ13827.1 phospholipid carrier-dependent glycosyltransferase [Promineifilum sp.]